MKSATHKVHGEAEIVPVNPLKNDKHKDVYIVRFDPVCSTESDVFRMRLFFFLLKMTTTSYFRIRSFALEASL